MWTNDEGFVHCNPTSVPGILTPMRQICFLLIGLLCAAAPALAQVTIDLHALDALPGARPATPESPAHKAVAKPAPKSVAIARPAKPSPQQATATPAPASPVGTPVPASPATTPATPAPPAATLPTAPPANVALAPIAPPPQTTPAAPPPPPPISDAATSAATATNSGLRVTFGTGETDLSPASASAIHGLVQATPASDNTSYNVVAYAAGTPEDPSTARRLSLSRALAVRSALIADGIASSRIYVRALGATEGDATPDRVDVAVLGANTATPASASAQPPAAAKSQQQ
jgi:outer membrane protein OmpA-like peptidoglycan-associated protein